jgi:di-N-acetylchitobiase
LRQAAFLSHIPRLQEAPILPGNPLALEFTALVAEAAAAFHAAIPGSQVSVDVPWSPYGTDDRHYDWTGLAEAVDLLFVMAYDTQSQARNNDTLGTCAESKALRRHCCRLLLRMKAPSVLSTGLDAVAMPLVALMTLSLQIWGRCVASANSPLALVRRGLQQWLQLGAPRSKLVLGLPW